MPLPLSATVSVLTAVTAAGAVLCARPARATETAAPDAAAPLVLGTRDGLDVVLFPRPFPHVRRVLPAVVVVLRKGAAAPADLVRQGRPLGGRSWRVPAADPLAAAAAWAARPEVDAADPDVLLPAGPRAAPAFDDPEYGGQWYLQKLGMEALYAVSLGTPDTRVAVIDSSIDIAHPDLAPAVSAPYDAVDADDDPSPLRGEFCPEGVQRICDDHGTAVAGIVAARANNGAGIVGLCPACTLVPIRLISEWETPLSADVSAFEHAIAQDAAVINNSWGFTEPTPAPASLARVIHRAATETRGGLGAVVVFAAGNDDRTLGDDELTGLPDVLCVSAADSYGRPTAYTNRGASVAVAAPSATVSIVPGNGITVTFGGTSAAAPVVSGLAAWALSVAPELSAAELRALFIETARQSPLITPDENGHHDVYGYGMVDPAALLARLVPEAVAPDAGVAPELDAAAPADAAAPEVDAGAPETDAAPADDSDVAPLALPDGGPDAARWPTGSGAHDGCRFAPGGPPGGAALLLFALPLGPAAARRRWRRGRQPAQPW